jgi:fucose permease
MLVVALVGGTVLPYATGLLGDAVGLRASFLLVPASLLAMGAVFTVARRGLAAGPTAG